MIVPVLPIPHCTSSRIRQISFSSQICLNPCKNSFVQGLTPPSPCTGSTIIAPVRSVSKALTLSKSFKVAYFTPSINGPKAC